MSVPLISVIVPVFNREKTLNRCLDSIILSTFRNIEILVVDDGSTDKSWEIIEYYSEMDSRIKAVRKDNGGVSSARNCALTHSRGKYISFVDSDDYIEVDIYEKCSNVIKNFEPDMITFNYAVAFENSEKTHITALNKVPINKILNRSFILDKIIPVMINLTPNKDYFINNFTWMKLFKRDIISKKHILFDETRKIWEDRIFQVLFLKYAQSFYAMADVGYYYVLGNSSFRSFSIERFESILRSRKDYISIWGDTYDFDIPYTYQYYFNVLNNTMFERIESEYVSKETIINCLELICKSNEVKYICSKYKPRNKFETRILDAILKEDCDLLFKLYNNNIKRNNLFRKVIAVLNRITRFSVIIIKKIISVVQ